MPYLLGIDGGTESLRAALFDPRGRPVAFASSAYPTRFPRPGWAEQDPGDWWRALGEATRRVLRGSGVSPDEVLALALDTTSCSVVALDARGEPVRPALIWMDVRSGEQAARIAACGDPALRVNGYGPVSAEWMAPKALWLLENERANFDAAVTLCEYQDYLNLHLTGRLTASLNNTSIRWHYDRSRGGFQTGLYRAVGLEEALARFPHEVVPMGEMIGGLTRRASEHLGLRAGTPVVQGGADAFVAMPGLGVVEPGSLAFITGSSHLHLGLSDRELSARGMWGSYPDAVVPGLHVVEGGQTSTGSVVAWLRRLLGEGASYEELGERASALPPGADGLVVLEHFQGNRTPHTDPDSRGVISGLTLAHTPAHLFRAVLEGVAYGTEDVLSAMRAGGYEPRRVVVCGGATRSELWLQIHADVSGLPLELTEVPDAPALGSAVLAAVGAGEYASIPEAARAMVRSARTVEPDAERHVRYRELLDAYRETYRALAPTLHRQAAVAREGTLPEPETAPA
ncbi:FGGY-family carbohydrate kinase [Deinococcus pimensis]|uniref:FGGY-family carbohydrate kinase n=1 Tax=Deinococcus pimensis TaxID=309888 RepID=UPI0004AD97D4|nr:FGGY-family carbohydrate kinase [Deinococcus pimensis]